MKKSLASLALAGSILLIGSVPATAATPAPYPAPSQQGNVTDATVAEGEGLTFSGGGMTAGEEVEVTATENGAAQSIGGNFSGGASMAVPARVILPRASFTFITTADANGDFAVPVSLPTEGTYTLTARGLTSGHRVTATITVVASGTNNGGTTTNNGGTTPNNGGTTTNNNGGTTTNNNGGTITSNGGGTITSNGGTAPTAGLADTGADTSLVLWSLVGAAALVAGITSVVVVRRRAKAGNTE